MITVLSPQFYIVPLLIDHILNLISQEYIKRVF